MTKRVVGDEKTQPPKRADIMIHITDESEPWCKRTPLGVSEP